MGKGHFCYLERDYFPPEEFKVSSQYGLIHMTDQPHTDLGAPIDAGWLSPGRVVRLPDTAEEPADGMDLADAGAPGGDR
jgi:hypothetical protein